MRSVVIFSLLFSFYSYGLGPHPFYRQKQIQKEQNSHEQKEISSALKDITEELRKDMKSLLFTLTHEQVDEERKLEIIRILNETALLNKEVEEALKDLVARGRKCENEEDQTACLILDIISLKAASVREPYHCFKGVYFIRVDRYRDKVKAV